MQPSNETPWATPLVGRDRDEPHRSATPLELFFDLTFVVAVAAAAGELHHELAESHWSGLPGYLAVFFLIWWAWMNFTWFASAYDTNDVLWRALTFVQMGGVLVLAAGVPRAVVDEDYGVVVLGYAVMRGPALLQWLRVARSDPDGRATAVRAALGIVILQTAWITWAVLGMPAGWLALAALAGGELLVPIIAERLGTTPWHPAHLVERYGLMTIIVLGEVVLATTGAITDALDRHGITSALARTVLGGLLIVWCLWWFYFKHSATERIEQERRESPFIWAYAHFIVYAAGAAVGAGLAVSVDVVENVALVSSRAAALTLGAPVAAYLIVLGVLHGLDSRGWRTLWRALVTSTVVLAVCLAGWEMGLTVLAVGCTLVAALLHFLVFDRDGRAQAVNEARAAAGRAVEHE